MKQRHWGPVIKYVYWGGGGGGGWRVSWGGGV